MSLRLSSQNFAPGAEIPILYTCEGKNVSPELSWEGVPKATRSLVLTVTDPDAPDPAAPKMTWVHWVLFNLPPFALGLPEAVDAESLPPPCRPGKNGWARVGYGGPCPPRGRHRYFHRLFALDLMLPDHLREPTHDEIMTLIQGHVIAEAELVGTYQKKF